MPRRHNGRPDWPASHPYTRAHLATHAARGGSIDDLAQDPGFLLAADPPELLAALDTTTSRPARAAAGAYRSALPLIRRHPPAEHAAYLGLAARCGRAEALADRIDADGLAGPWRARWASWQLQRPHQQITGHDGPVNAVAAAELDGRPVVISGSDDGTVRVWDLATGTPVGDPFTGHGGPVNAVAAAELDGRPVVISGSGDGTVRVWDLATGTPVGDPFTGHDGAVRAVAAAELDGRPVVISGSGDGTVRVWDLATGAPVGDPFTGHGGCGDGGGGGRAGWPPGGHLRQQRRDGAGVGPGHRPLDPHRSADPVHRPRPAAVTRRWRRRELEAARWSSPAATTGRCGCGTWPPAPRSATRSPATAAR